MFKFFRSRPPIIIINEAEHKEPPAVIKERTAWEKYAGVVCLTTIVLHFIAIAFILNIMNEIKQNQDKVNNALLVHLQMTDSLYNNAAQKIYTDSILTAKRYMLFDSTNKLAFDGLYKQLKLMEKQNAAYFRIYQSAQQLK